MNTWSIPPKDSDEWQRLRDKLLDVAGPECDHPNNWVCYFDRLRDAIEEYLEP
jgi:hypothetical protein